MRAERDRSWALPPPRPQVLDDPRLLRKSLKKEAKLKAKKAAAWQDRVTKQKEQQQARQTK